MRIKSHEPPSLHFQPDTAERAKSTDTAADSGRCDFRESITADNADDLGTVGGFFVRSIQTNPMIFMSDRLSVAFFFPEGRIYSPPAKQAVVSLPLVRLVCSSRSVFQPLLQRGQAMSQANIPCAVGSIFCAINQDHQLSWWFALRL